MVYSLVGGVRRVKKSRSSKKSSRRGSKKSSRRSSKRHGSKHWGGAKKVKRSGSKKAKRSGSAKKSKRSGSKKSWSKVLSTSRKNKYARELKHYVTAAGKIKPQHDRQVRLLVIRALTDAAQ